MNLTCKTLAELSELFQSGKVRSREIIEAFITEIEAREKDIHAFVTTTFDTAREMADEADARYKNGALLSPLDGMPIVLKDVICTTECKTTACSNILKEFQSPYDATVWKKLKEAGAVLLGKTNTDEFTMGASTQTSAFGVTKNPYNLEYVAGGSSGGSAAAIAANFCAGALGTETNGSIRHPSHFCGVTGLKVSYGRVSRWGTMPMASSLDVVGPMAKTAKDCAMILQVIAGHDEKDSTTPNVEVPEYVPYLEDSIRGMKIGVPRSFFENGIDPDVAQVMGTAEAQIRDLGAEIIDIDLPHAKYAVAAYYIIAPGEISSNQARYDGIRYGECASKENLEKNYTETRFEGFGDEVKRRILIGTFVLSAGYSDQYYRQAQRVRTLIRQDFDEAWKDVDAILSPVSPTPAFKVGGNLDDPLKMYLEDMFLAPSCLAGQCGISIPVGTSDTGLPIGIQIICPEMQEARVLKIAHQMQKNQL
jgi:aspartyl-tRNA(Asn)/glutamyl-tRNA(Gln) amidotransferase subunit A